MISRSCEEPLPPLKRLGLRLHLMGCRHCSRYVRQVQWLRSLFREYPERLPGERLSTASLEKIVERLRGESQPGG
jgi:hypothetical protein